MKDSDESQKEDDNNESQNAFTRSLIYNDNLAVRKTPESVEIDFPKNSATIDTKHCSAKTYSNCGVEPKIVRKHDKMHTKICMHSG